jgi:hypothetical protein
MAADLFTRHTGITTMAPRPPSPKPGDTVRVIGGTYKHQSATIVATVSPVSVRIRLQTGAAHTIRKWNVQTVPRQPQEGSSGTHPQATGSRQRATGSRQRATGTRQERLERLNSIARQVETLAVQLTELSSNLQNLILEEYTSD